MGDYILPIVIGLVVFVGAFSLGFYFKQIALRDQMKAAAENAARLVADATAKQRELLLEAKDEALRLRTAVEAELRERRADLQRQERRLQQREENLDRKVEGSERRERALQLREKEIDGIRQEAENIKQQQRGELERVSNLGEAEARAMPLQAIEDEVRVDALRRVREIEQEAKEEAGRRARSVVALAIQRCAADQVAETTVSVVPLPNDEMKGRIIGREGRNIRALEAATGVDLIIDDTPDAVTLSGFDPVRREIARVALEQADPRRPHPPGAHRRGRAEGTARGRSHHPRGGRAGRLRGRRARPAPRTDPAAGPPEVPHQLRPERAAALHRGRRCWRR